MTVELLDMEDCITGKVDQNCCDRLCVTVYKYSTHSNGGMAYDKCLSFISNGISQTVILLNVSDNIA